VQVRRIVGADGRGDASLGITGVSFFGFRFGEDEDVAGAAQLDRRAKRGDAAADDEKGRTDAAILPPGR
jgi:hypothetical protein